jgi:hypothetical protein
MLACLDSSNQDSLIPEKREATKIKDGRVIMAASLRLSILAIAHYGK